MRKSELLEMKPLRATDKMMRLAREDRSHIVQYTDWWGNQCEQKRYQYRMFLRCTVEGDRLKMAIFFPHEMRLGAREATFEVYIDRKERCCLTYDRPNQKWRTAMLDHLEIPGYVREAEENWMSQKDAKMLKAFLGTEGSAESVLRYQRQLREEALVRRDKRQTDPWDEDMKQVPALPKDWDTWVTKVGIPENYIFYTYDKKGVTSGYCTYCEKEVPVRKPRYNKEAVCPCCRHKITYKAVGRVGRLWTESAYLYLLQRCRDGFVLREFSAWRHYPKGGYQHPEVHVNEVRRVLYDYNAKHPRAYYWGDYKHRSIRWIETNVCSPGWHGYSQGRVYGKTIPTLSKRELSRTGLPEAIRMGPIDPEKYLAVLREVPLLEKLAKAGLNRMTQQCLNGYYEFQRRFKDSVETELHKILGVSQQELKRLRREDGGLSFLEWLQYEHISGRPVPDEVISWFCREKIAGKDLKFIQKNMSALQVRNYIRRQMRELNMSSREVLTTWADYLSMAKRFGMDTNDEIVYKVRKLKIRHDELARRGAGKNLTIRAGEILAKFPHVEEICRSVEDKFGYVGNEYMIVVPTKIEDVLWEGDQLCHCIANSERYWERIERRESFLLFLRKTKEPTQAYYTLEVEPDGTVRQIRTKYDRQGKDIGMAREFLRVWQKVVAERLSGDDRAMAETSRTLRQEEFSQMRKDRVIIHTGALAGHLLVDVLTADLMENVA